MTGSESLDLKVKNSRSFNIGKFFIYFSIIVFTLVSTVIVYKMNFNIVNKQYSVLNKFDAQETYADITNDLIITQSFICSADNLSGISIKFNDFNRRTDANIIISLRDAASGAEIKNWHVSTLLIKGNVYNDFTFEPIVNSKTREYIISLRYGKVEENKFVAPMYNSDPSAYSSGKLSVNDKSIDGVLGFSQLIYNQTAEKAFNTGMLVFAASLVVIILASYVHRDNISKIFPVLAFTLGLIYVVTTPAFRAPDEDVHFFRSYEIAEGNFKSDMFNDIGGRMLPASLKLITEPGVKEIKYKDTLAAFSIDLEPDTRTFIEFPTASLYSPMAYYPQAFGIWLAGQLGLGPMFMLYFGRIASLVVWVFLMHLAMQIMFFGNRTVFLLALTPMSMYTVASLSADTLTNAFSFLYIAFVLYLFCGQEKRISPIQIGFLIFLSIGISLCKIVYIPLCLICFIIPRSKFSSLKSYLVLMFSIVFISFGINLLWLSIAAVYTIDYINIGVNANMQLNFIFQDIFRYVQIILYTLFNYGNFYLQSFFGSSLGWFDVPVYTFISAIYFMVLLFTILTDNVYKVKFSAGSKWLIGFICLSITVLIFTSLYMVWTRVGENLVSGVQGRYFTPIAPLFLALLNNSRIKIHLNESRFNFLLSCFVILIHFPILSTILNYHI